MLPLPIIVTSQMQQFSAGAVTVARDKFNIRLNYGENSLRILDVLLQQAHEQYQQTSRNDTPANISIENTVRIWGSYLGEVIRRSLGGDWIAEKKNVFLQIGSRRLDPLGQVRSRIIDGSFYNVHGFFLGLNPLVKVNQAQRIIKSPPETNIIHPLGESGERAGNRSSVYIGGSVGMFFLICLFSMGSLFFLRQGITAVPILGNFSQKSIATVTMVPTPASTQSPGPTINPTSTLAPLTAGSQVSTPLPFSFSVLTQSDLEKAQITPSDLAFGGLHQAADWNQCMAGLNLDHSIFDPIEGLPNAELMLTSAFSTDQTCGGFAGDSIQDDLFVFQDEYHAKRFMAIAANGCTMLASLGTGQSQSSNENDSQIITCQADTPTGFIMTTILSQKYELVVRQVSGMSSHLNPADISGISTTIIERLTASVQEHNR
jgi:hypothetical protein